MMRMLVLLLVAGVVPLATAVPPAVAPAPRPITEREAFFRSGKVLNLSLEFDKKAADSLRRDYRTYVKCKLRDGDKVYEDVGVHLKGAAGSLRGFDDKPGLTLNMDKFNDGARYRGMDKFHLSNSVQDPSYLSELLCGEIFRAAGVPAARWRFGFCTRHDRRSQSRGFYYLKEGHDREFLKTHFGNADCNLYDGGFLPRHRPAVATGQHQEGRRGSQGLYLFAAAREPDAKKRFERLEKLLDLDSFISYMVVEAITRDRRLPVQVSTIASTTIRKRTRSRSSRPHGSDVLDVGGPAARLRRSVAAATNTPEGMYYARMREILRDVYKPEQP
ncbi:MAG: CotH kinase family protein [Gemmataceae bacterium]